MSSDPMITRSFFWGKGEMKKVKRNQGGRVLLSARTESNQRCVGGRLRCAPSLRRCAQAACPQTPILRESATLAGQFVPAGKIKIYFSSTLGPLGPNAIKICRSLPSIARRLVRPYLFGAAVVGQMPQRLPSYPGFARVGGVRTAQIL